ncbi:MAG: methyl-accepting chemotaxis protein [Lachnospiraceae bacterium]|nr:methyl-accepting chemotaxis protein [Lachnospiraceae bacterium]
MGKSQKKERKASASSIQLKDSIKFKLIAVMIAVAAIPVLVSLVISYNSSTKKALEDAKVSQQWQARYIASEFSDIVKRNLVALETLASSPATTMYLSNGGDENLAGDMLAQLKSIDAIFEDGNATIISGADGMQRMRSDGNNCVDITQREYFQTAMTGVANMSNAIVSSSTGELIAVITAPIFDANGAVIGTVQRNFSLSSFHEFLASQAEDAFITDRAGIVAAHSQHEIDVNEEMEDRSNSVYMTSGLDEGFYESDTGKGYTAYIAYGKEETTGYTVCVASTSSEVMASARAAATMVVIIGLILMIVAIALSFYIANMLTAPIEDINASLAALADGRFVKVEKHGTRKDEFGSMVKSTNAVITTLDDIVKDIKASSISVATSSDELSSMAHQISQTTEDVSNAVQDIAAGATQQAEEIQTATTNVGYIGDAISDVKDSSATLKELADRMQESSSASSTSLTNLQNSSNEMTEKIDEISTTISATQDAVSNINEKVEGISSIATQTNLLSLNASIEAARAGEAGRGFAVVAEEIGKLAADSKNMADEIRQQMDILLAQSNTAVHAAKEVKDANLEQQSALGETLSTVAGMITDIESTITGVEDISRGASSCDDSKNAVIDTMSALSAISEENAASSEETGASMEELTSTITTLANSSADLKDIANHLNEDMKFFK